MIKSKYITCSNCNKGMFEITYDADDNIVPLNKECPICGESFDVIAAKEQQEFVQHIFDTMFGLRKGS